MSKLVKNMEFTALEKTFSAVRDLVLITPAKIDATLDFNFRKQLREKKVKVQMVKNSLVRRVFDASGIKLEDKTWTGTTLVAWGADSLASEPASPAMDCGGGANVWAVTRGLRSCSTSRRASSQLAEWLGLMATM